MRPEVITHEKGAPIIRCQGKTFSVVKRDSRLDHYMSLGFVYQRLFKGDNRFIRTSLYSFDERALRGAIKESMRRYRDIIVKNKLVRR